MAFYCDKETILENKKAELAVLESSDIEFIKKNIYNPKTHYSQAFAIINKNLTKEELNKIADDVFKDSKFFSYISMAIRFDELNKEYKGKVKYLGLIAKEEIILHTSDMRELVSLMSDNSEDVSRLARLFYNLRRR